MCARLSLFDRQASTQTQHNLQTNNDGHPHNICKYVYVWIHASLAILLETTFEFTARSNRPYKRPACVLTHSRIYRQQKINIFIMFGRDSGHSLIYIHTFTCNSRCVSWVNNNSVTSDPSWGVMCMWSPALPLNVSLPNCGATRERERTLYVWRTQHIRAVDACCRVIVVLTYNWM